VGERRSNPPPISSIRCGEVDEEVRRGRGAAALALLLLPFKGERSGRNMADDAAAFWTKDRRVGGRLSEVDEGGTWMDCLVVWDDSAWHRSDELLLLLQVVKTEVVRAMRMHDLGDMSFEAFDFYFGCSRMGRSDSVGSDEQ